MAQTGSPINYGGPIVIKQSNNKSKLRVKLHQYELPQLLVTDFKSQAFLAVIKRLL